MRALVDNITFANIALEAQVPGRPLDPGLVKVVELAQLMIEFFHSLYTRVEHHATALQQRFDSVVQERDTLRSELELRVRIIFWAKLNSVFRLKSLTNAEEKQDKVKKLTRCCKWLLT